METIHGNLTVRTTNRELEISNGHVSVLMYIRDGGYVQEFYAVDQKGNSKLLLSSLHKNLIPSSEHRACTSPMISGDRPHLFNVCRESLRMVYSQAEIIHHCQEKAVACLSGSAQGHSLECKITIRDGSNAVHVEVNDKIEHVTSNPLIEYLMSSYAFLPGGATIFSASELSYAWAPNLRPANDHVIGDCAFHSPAIIVQKGHDAAALIPDLDILSENRTMPTALDLDLQNGLLPTPLLSYGFCGYEKVDGSEYYRHDITMSRRLNNPHLTYGYSLILNTNSKSYSACKEATNFLWTNYGAKSAKHQPVQYTDIAPLPELIPDARAAYGLYSCKEEQPDTAKFMKDAVLSSPQDNGLFPTKFDAKQNEWIGCNNSIDDSYYHTVECSEQLYWLLKWHQNIEKDQRIISYCRKYADYLINARLRTGAIPSWFSKDHIPLSALRSSIQTAASALFLAELGKVTGLKKYINATEISAKFLLTKLVPHYMYHDYTLVDVDNGSTTQCADPHTGVQPQSGLGMLWTSRLCLQLYKLTENQPYLDQGQRILDHMCLLQSVWDMPFLAEHQHKGLCVKGNLGANYDAELSAEFARCTIEYGMLRGEPEYIERGKAALEAAESVRDINTLTKARVAASAAAIRDLAGSVYVHVSKKWAVPTNGAQILRFTFDHNEISMDISSANNENTRIVFGGMRGRTYKLCLNNHHFTCTADEMKSGILIPKITADQGQYSLELNALRR